MLKPIASESKVPINSDLDAYYTVFTDGAMFRRPPSAWDKFIPRSVVIIDNPRIVDGVEWIALQHCQIVVAGTALYEFSDAAGEPVTAQWGAGDHNISNGVGHLPAKPFMRTFGTGFETCCILPAPGRSGALYDFAAVSGTVAGLAHIVSGARKGQTVTGATLASDEMAISITLTEQ